MTVHLQYVPVHLKTVDGTRLNFGGDSVCVGTIRQEQKPTLAVARLVNCESADHISRIELEIEDFLCGTEEVTQGMTEERSCRSAFQWRYGMRGNGGTRRTSRIAEVGARFVAGSGADAGRNPLFLSTNALTVAHACAHSALGARLWELVLVDELPQAVVVRELLEALGEVLRSARRFGGRRNCRGDRAVGTLGGMLSRQGGGNVPSIIWGFHDQHSRASLAERRCARDFEG